jgi:hypothetical protein
VNSYPPEDLTRSRLVELRAEARLQILARLARCPRSLSDALCRMRTRIGGMVIAIGRRIVPEDMRVGIPTQSVDHC